MSCGGMIEISPYLTIGLTGSRPWKWKKNKTYWKHQPSKMDPTICEFKFNWISIQISNSEQTLKKRKKEEYESY